MEQHDFQQGSPEWHRHRASHFNASDAPAMMGANPYKSRTQLLDEISSGIIAEVDPATQRRFDDGHRFETLARPLAEKIIGRKLYPVIGSEGKLSASFDGLTADDSIAFEHKTLNSEIVKCDSADDLPEMYRIQMEQQLLLSGAEKCLFMASEWDESDCLVSEVHFWYEPDFELRDRIIFGWNRFAKDLETHEPKIIAERPRPQVEIDLPTLYVQAHGAVTGGNMEEFGKALSAKLEAVRSIKLITDQDFSNAKEAAKLFREQCQKIKQAKDAMLEQTVSIGEAARMMDAWHEDLRVTALQLEKDVEREDLAKKRAMIAEAALSFTAHVEALEAETKPIQLSLVKPDFAAAIKGKRNYASMQDAVDTELANGKILADTVARDIRQKLDWFRTVEEYRFLFADLQTIIFKPSDDFHLVVNTRISAHKEQEENRLEAERERIRIEEEAKAAEKSISPEQNPEAIHHDHHIADDGKMIQNIAPLRTEDVIGKQSIIRAFLDSKDFKDRDRIRAILVEYEKFKGGFGKDAV